ncbi:MAG: hypothetical protein ACI4U0_00465 [Candidatus Aphodocola sp.]
MKKYNTLILSILFFIISFIKNWYSDELFDKFFLLALVPSIILIVLFNVILIKSIIQIDKRKEYINVISIIILLISIIFFFFPYREVKTKYELDKYEPERLQIIKMIEKRQLKPKDELGNISLPNKYKKYSISDEVFLYQNNEKGQVVGFWVFRGMLSGSTELIYSTGGKKLIKANETNHRITKIKKLKDKWYYVETDY